LKPLHHEYKSTLIGMTTILVCSASIGLFRSISEVFGPVDEAAIIFNASGLIGLAVLGLPNVYQMRPMYLSGMVIFR